MPAPLSAEHLTRHVRALADEIETLPFPAPDTWRYSMIYPVLLVLASNGWGRRKRAGRLLGGLLALTGAYFLWKAASCGRHPLTKPAPRRPSATLIARVPPTGAVPTSIAPMTTPAPSPARLAWRST